MRLVATTTFASGCSATTTRRSPLSVVDQRWLFAVAAVVTLVIDRCPALPAGASARVPWVTAVDVPPRCAGADGDPVPISSLVAYASVLPAERLVGLVEIRASHDPRQRATVMSRGRARGAVARGRLARACRPGSVSDGHRWYRPDDERPRPPRQDHRPARQACEIRHRAAGDGRTVEDQAPCSTCCTPTTPTRTSCGSTSARRRSVAGTPTSGDEAAQCLDDLRIGRHDWRACRSSPAGSVAPDDLAVARCEHLPLGIPTPSEPIRSVAVPDSAL